MIRISYRPVSMREYPVETMEINSLKDLFNLKRIPGFPKDGNIQELQNLRYMYVEIEKGGTTYSKVCPIYGWGSSCFNYIKNIIFHEYAYDFVEKEDHR